MLLLTQTGLCVMTALLHCDNDARKADSQAVNRNGWRLAWQESGAGTSHGLEANAASRPKRIAFTLASLRTGSLRPPVEPEPTPGYYSQT